LTGLYIGAHAGYSRGSLNRRLSDPATPQPAFFSGVIGGVQAGYNYSPAVRDAARGGSRYYFSKLSYLEFGRSSLATARSAVTGQWDYVATARRPRRLRRWFRGWAYATGGLAWAGERFHPEQHPGRQAIIVPCCTAADHAAEGIAVAGVADLTVRR